MSVPVLFNRLGGASPADETRVETPVPERVDAAVVGAGVIGLSVAWQLAARGLSVALIEARRAGGGTSAAATGMLAAAAELEPGGETLLELARESQALWPGFGKVLEGDAGQSIDYRDEGTLVLALGRDEIDRLRFRHELHRRCGLDTRWLASAEARQIEPGLRPAVTAGMFCAADHQVDPLLTLAALRRGFLRCGGWLVEEAEVKALDIGNGQVGGVVFSDTRVRARTVVLASGPAVSSAGWLPPGLHLPVRPLKGQSLALRPRAGEAGAPIEHVVWTADIHLAPKSDGRLIVGATVEECGFEPAVTAGGVFALLDGARRVLPGIEEMAIESMWSGFRPTSDDDAPILGETGVGGLAVAVGHHRNGYLLAPVTAEAIASLVTTGAIQGAAQNFGIGRFGAAPARPVQQRRGAA